MDDGILPVTFISNPEIDLMIHILIGCLTVILILCFGILLPQKTGPALFKKLFHINNNKDDTEVTEKEILAIVNECKEHLWTL